MFHKVALLHRLEGTGTAQFDAHLAVKESKETSGLNITFCPPKVKLLQTQFSPIYLTIVQSGT